jgi:hypothetical protein
MPSARKFFGLVLLFTVLTLTLVSPAGALTVFKLQLEAGSHVFMVDGHEMVVENNHPLVIQVNAREGIIQGVIEAANESERVTVRIILVGPPDVVIFDGQASDPVDFDSSSADETGHSEL